MVVRYAVAVIDEIITDSCSVIPADPVPVGVEDENEQVVDLVLGYRVLRGLGVDRATVHAVVQGKVNGGSLRLGREATLVDAASGQSPCGDDCQSNKYAVYGKMPHSLLS